MAWVDHLTQLIYYKNDPHAKEMTPTAFDPHQKAQIVHIQMTRKQNITDSAAGGTAFSSGHKTYNGAIGVDSNKQKEDGARTCKRKR